MWGHSISMVWKHVNTATNYSMFSSVSCTTCSFFVANEELTCSLDLINLAQSYMYTCFFFPLAVCTGKHNWPVTKHAHFGSTWCFLCASRQSQSLGLNETVIFRPVAFWSTIWKPTRQNSVATGQAPHKRMLSVLGPPLP